MATFTQMVDDMKTCPYNPLHKVSARRLQQHIVKCSKNSANPILQDCPFNALHKIPANQLQHHILQCKDSRQVIREIEESRNRMTPQNNPVIVHRTENPVSSEDWDQDIDERPKGYVIPGLIEDDGSNSGDDTNSEYRFKTNIEIQCMKPAERKLYYKQMVEKAKEVKEVETIDDKKSGSLSSRQSTSETESLSQTSSSGSTSEVKSESSVPDLRKPTTKPFTRIGGIGRGNTPSLSGRASANRQIGVGRSIPNTNSNHLSDSIVVKREPEGDLPDKRVKRFSPDPF